MQQNPPRGFDTRKTGKIVVRVLHAFGNNKHLWSDRQNRIARALVGKSYIMLDVAIAPSRAAKTLAM
jgi:hypothetical protein